MPVYDDEKQKNHSTIHTHTDEELRRLTGINKEQEEAHDREAKSGAERDIAAREGVNSKASDTVGRGYQDEERHERRRKKRKSRTSKTKKKISAILFGMVISIVIAVFSFFSLLPLRVVSFMANVNNVYRSAEQSAIKKVGHRLFQDYVVTDMLNALDKKGCHSTIEPGCIVLDHHKGPIGKLYKAWSQNKLERKLADNGVIFGRKGSTYYMNVNGNRMDLSRVIKGDEDLFNMKATKTVRNPAEMRQAVKQAFQDETLWKRVYYRFKVGQYLVKHLGLPRCIGVIGCSNPDSRRSVLGEKIRDRKLAAKAFVLGRVIEPMNQGWAIIGGCIMSGDCHGKKGDMEYAHAGDYDRQTPLSRQINKTMVSYALKEGSKPLKDLVEKADKISKYGFKAYLTRSIIQGIGKAVGKDISEDIAKKVSTKVIPGVGWALLAFTVIDAAAQIGPMVQHVSYAVNSGAVSNLYQTYNTVAEQSKEGQIDTVKAGSFSESLAGNLSPDAPAVDQVDATRSHMYGATFGQDENQVALTNFVNTKALAASAAPTTGVERCNDGSILSASKLTCPEENLAYGNPFASGITKLTKDLVPGIILKAIHFIKVFVGKVASVAFWPLEKLCYLGPDKANPCAIVMNKVSDVVSGLLGWVVEHLITPFITLFSSGARVADGIMAGADVVTNETCKALVGCKKISAKQAAMIRNQQMAEIKQTFDSKPLFARIFSTNTPYSFVSRLAVSMPSSLTLAGANTASMFAVSPFASFGGLMGSVFSTSRAFAAVPATADPFGVDQYGVPDADIPKHPLKAWKKYGCQKRYDAATSTLDNSEWLNNDKNVGFNDATGESTFKRVDECRLILSGIQSVGGMFDPSLLPSGTLNNNSAAGSSFRIGTFNVEHWTSGNWKLRADKAINVIKQSGADIIGFQEMEGPQPGYFMQALGDTYAKYQNGSNQRVIMWNKTEFKKVGAGKNQLIYFCGKLQSYPYVKLQDTRNGANGQEFYVVNTHDPANAQHCPSMSAHLRYLDAQIHIKFIKKLEQSGLPVLFTGDFNSSYDGKPFGKNGSAWKNQPQNLTYCMFTQESRVLNDAYDVYSKRKVKCPNKTPPNMAGGIDHVYLSPGIDVSGYTSYGTNEDGSDHHALFFDVIIPGSTNTATGTGSNGTFVLFGRDGFGYGSCVVYVEYVMRRHLPAYAKNPITFGAGAKVAAKMHSTYGYTLDHNPAPGAIVSFPAGYHANSAYGHVGIVRTVDKTGIVMQSSNYPLDNDRYQTVHISSSIAKNLWYAHVENDWR